MFDDNVLLRINRQYERDEAVQYLVNRVKQKCKEVGQLKSEVVHLKHIESKLKAELKEFREYEDNAEVYKRNYRDSNRGSIPKLIRNWYEDQIKDLKKELEKFKADNQRLLLKVTQLQLKNEL